MAEEAVGSGSGLGAPRSPAPDLCGPRCIVAELRVKWGYFSFPLIGKRNLI